ncbi:MAG: RNA pseudouridine synthase [Patescibacteria group bacterium]|nr:RNA pseudouridine synthase [Patescibacteria group bacterium]MCL5262099.1 RNA pseudouridine synthase [Patescibacteria group bacterium]
MIQAIPVIYEDRNLLVVDKPAGILMHKTSVKEGEETLADWLTANHPEVKTVGDDPKTRPGIVHRLDKETSGVVVIAKDQQTFEYLKSLFQNHGVRKTYLALVYGAVEPREGIIEKPIGLKSGTVRRTVHGGKMVKEAATEYKVLKDYDGFSLVEARPKTGRTHQIRVHFASINHPVVGDALYGGKKAKANSLGLNRQFLHASSIEFIGPDKTRFRFESKLPVDLTKALKSI